MTATLPMTDDERQTIHLLTEEWTTGAVVMLCDTLGIDRNEVGWRDALAPWAGVLAAMISAADATYRYRSNGSRGVGPPESQPPQRHGTANAKANAK